MKFLMSSTVSLAICCRWSSSSGWSCCPGLALLLLLLLLLLLRLVCCCVVVSAISNSSDVEAFMFILTFYLIARTAHILTPLFCHAPGCPFSCLLLPPACLPPPACCVAFAASGMRWYASVALSLSLSPSASMVTSLTPPTAPLLPLAAAN